MQFDKQVTVDVTAVEIGEAIATAEASDLAWVVRGMNQGARHVTDSQWQQRCRAAAATIGDVHIFEVTADMLETLVTELRDQHAKRRAKTIADRFIDGVVKPLLDGPPI